MESLTNYIHRQLDNEFVIEGLDIDPDILWDKLEDFFTQNLK